MVVMMASDRQDHYQQFLAGLILCVAAGTATIWWFTGFFLAVAYASGASTVLIFTWVAPTYVAPEEDTETEQNPGFQ